MSKIDLSKAKIGDKFRMRSGFIITYYECEKCKSIDRYLLQDEDGCVFYYHENGKFILHRDTGYDLIEQVLDKPLDEIEEGTKLIKENDDAIAEEKELQRRQEVLKYADMLFFNQKDTRIALFGYDVAIETAEIIVKSRDKYLKDGKL